ncbi:CRISPR-associated helicase Cas3' [Brachybacterium hainanense]|uniref:CRISPR-associated helicase Cas3 n=1 Tax=Brachybacterium hainanense TaxID=1541174 RepID=A0ABV6R897_9MICO
MTAPPISVDDLRHCLSDAARSFWAKSGDDRARETGDEPWLALPQHMLDSYGVARHLWVHWAPFSVRSRISAALEMPDEDAGTVVAWLAGVHDIGKAVLSFQGQLQPRPGFENFLQRLQDAGLPIQMPWVERNGPAVQHALASRVLVRDWLIREGLPSRTGRIADRLSEIVDAHHGAPSREGRRTRADLVIQTYDGAWAATHQELLDFVADLSGIRGVLPRLRERRRKPLNASGQSLITGLVIMADWIASNADHFPLTIDGLAGERAEACMADFELTRPWRATPPGSHDEALDEHLRDRFRWPASHRARPVQRAAAQAAAALRGSGLLIIEAPTGEGKTEAALTAAEILGASCGAGGIMVAAPTMATADGLFRRVLDWARRAGGDEATSLFLAHSKNMLNRDYRDLTPREVGIDEDSTTAQPDGAVIASQWLSGRKKGILANVTVGTVDQVLIMALQAKHSMLRHLGLAGKVIVIDEVHAYDTYMSEYLATALRWLSRYRVPVVLLSATLPVAQKTLLVEAYRSELSHEPLDELSTEYPLITSVSAQGVHETVVPQRSSDLEASLSTIDDGLTALADRLQQETTDGGCVLIICNTVHRAQDVYRYLEDVFPGDVELHHAAFLASERARKETTLREVLGPQARRGDGRPHRRFVVATQVAEQSLDIDVDLLVTDIAPMDLLIQRIGRLHRHERPADDRPRNLQHPQVLIRGIISPETPEFDGGALAVYGEEMLLATLAALQDGPLEHGFTRPDDIAALVHRTYSDAPPIPADWSDAWDAAVRTAHEERDSARKRSGTYRIPPPAAAASLDSLFAYQRESIDTAAGEEKGFAQVRDSDPTVEVIPILAMDGGWYRPLVGGAGTDLNPDLEPPRRVALDLAAATVRLPSRFTRCDPHLEEVLDQLEPLTPRGWQQSTWLKGQLALPLDAQHRITVRGRILAYDAALGLHEVEGDE